ncbi:hypothetical protein [Hyalangium versicolor]|uniref:hypothetical protein n=1 Tax=Hyalangium versicolor TaxID=2861190 RepID=UPI001CCDD07D|nr:hypothetical protein [Hyalangium versicolor]
MTVKKVVSWMLMLSGLALFAACEGEPKAPEVIASHEPGDLALFVERASGSGPYVESTTERFRLVASGEPFKSVRWSANAGTLVPDADQVTWTLPGAGTASLSVTVETESGKTAEGSFSFNVAPVIAASTQIDPGLDKTGAACKLVFDKAGTGHVIYTNDSHGSLMYASWDGTTWKTEQIESLGGGNGATVSSVITPSLAVDPDTGTPHVAYAGAIDGSTTYRIRYATRVNGAWVREEVDPANHTTAARLSIGLNPAQGQQPVIVFSDSAAGLQRATRTAANTWSVGNFPSANAPLTSNIIFNQTGTLYITIGNGGLLAFNGTTVETYGLSLDPTYAKWISLAWGPSQHILAATNGNADAASSGFLDITVGTPLSSSVFKTAEVDYEHDSSDLAYGAGKPYVALRHGTTLELLTTDARRFWTYTQLGTVQDGSRVSVAVRPTDGTPHVCYQRDSKVTFQ